MDPQAEIDKLIAKNPQVLQYVEWVKYVPQGQPSPEGTTHTLKLANTLDDVVVALKVKRIYSVLVDALLKVL
jgi:hypothetical protein